VECDADAVATTTNISDAATAATHDVFVIVLTSVYYY